MEAEKSKMKVLYLERIFLLHHNMVECTTLVREHKRKREKRKNATHLSKPSSIF
jgi:hypothetical protein